MSSLLDLCSKFLVPHILIGALLYKNKFSLMKKLYSYLPYALIDGFVHLLTQHMSSLMDCAISNPNSLIQKI